MNPPQTPRPASLDAPGIVAAKNPPVAAPAPASNAYADRTWGSIPPEERLAIARSAYEAHCRKYSVTPDQWDSVKAGWLKRVTLWHSVARAAVLRSGKG